MARVFRHEYTTVDPRSGKRIRRYTRKWYIEYRPAGTRKSIRVPGLPTKALTEILAARLESEADRIRAGIATHAETAAASLAIDTAILEYIGDLRAKGRTSAHCELVNYRLRAVATGCSWDSPISMDSVAAQRWLREQMTRPAADRPMSAQTQCHYIATLRGFANWLVEKRKLPASPFLSLERANVASGRRHVRRALSDADFWRLIDTTRGNPTGPRFVNTPRTPYGLAGVDRAALYLIAAYTGLRASELASLDHSSVSIDSTPPAIQITADDAKNRKAFTIPIPVEVARQFARWLKGRPPRGAIWPGEWASQCNAGIMLKRDLRDAGIDYRDKATGRVFDFHALRAQYATMLARAGVPLVQAQRLMRHSDPRLTANFYTHLDLGDLAGEVEKLPPPPKRSRGKK